MAAIKFSRKMARLCHPPPSTDRTVGMAATDAQLLCPRARFRRSGIGSRSQCASFAGHVGNLLLHPRNLPQSPAGLLAGSGQVWKKMRYLRVILTRSPSLPSRKNLIRVIKALRFGSPGHAP
jgi:hypothetical protein